MHTSISAAPTRQAVRQPRIVDGVLGVLHSWWGGWVRFASQMRGGVK